MGYRGQVRTVNKIEYGSSLGGHVYDQLVTFLNECEELCSGFYSFAVSFGALAILLSASQYVRSVTTYQMVKTLYAGALASAIIKGAVMFFIFQVIAALITPAFFVKYFKDIVTLFPAYKSSGGDLLMMASNLVAEIKPIFRISAMIMLAFSFITSIILSIKWIRMRKTYLQFKNIKEYREKGDAGL